MQERIAKETMLKKIRQSLITKTDPHYPSLDWEKSVYALAEGASLEEQFAIAFKKSVDSLPFAKMNLTVLKRSSNLLKQKNGNNSIAGNDHCKNY